MKRLENEDMGETNVNKTHDIFLLMLNLSQFRSEEKIIDFFLSAMENMWDGTTFQFDPGLDDHCKETVLQCESILIATPKRSFGTIILGGDSPGGQNMALVRNAVRMLAIILENREQERLLADEKIHLEEAVKTRTAELESLNEELRSKIEEMERLENQLLQTQKMEAIGKLAGGIAHDFNNILGAIIGYAELAAYKSPGTGPVRKYLDKVLVSSDRARKIVSQILTFSRKSSPERKPLPLESIVKDTVNLMRSTLPSTIELRVDVEPCGRVVLGNGSQLQQVLMNICNNAAHAVEGREKDALIEVGLKEVTITPGQEELDDLTAGPYFYLTVRDNGCGIKPEILKQIFDPFFTTKSKSSHSGMGLAVVHGIVKSCRGDIRVDSIPGRGTLVEIYLPAIAAEEPCIEETGTDTVLSHRGDEVILFVDDESNLVEVGKDMLGQYGYSVEGFNRPPEALAAFKADPGRFHLVITDNTMPKMTGVQFAAAIKDISPGTPVILCTGFADSVDMAKIKKIGIGAFVNKPYSQKHFIDTVRKVLNRNK